MDLQSVIHLRPAGIDDREFLYALYRTTREGELKVLGWSDTQLEAFVQMQFDAQARSYSAQYPDAENSIIMLDGLLAGRMIVACETDALLLVDIALMPEHQRRGIGGHLLRELMNRASRESVRLRLHVLASNSPAIRFYEQLGMRRTGGDEVYLHMEWVPSR